MLSFADNKSSSFQEFDFGVLNRAMSRFVKLQTIIQFVVFCFSIWFSNHATFMEPFNSNSYFNKVLPFIGLTLFFSCATS